MFIMEIQKIDIVQNFVYLGIKFSTSGNWNEALKDLKTRGLRAYFKMKKLLGNLFTQDIILSLKLFDSLVKPILLYCSDIWGADERLNEISPIEQVHTKFLKQLLQVNTKATNIGVRAELVRIPIVTFAKIQALKNWIRITLNKCNTLVFNIYTESFNIINCWSKNIKNILFKHGLGDIWFKYASLNNNIGNTDQLEHIISSVNIITKQRILDCCFQETRASIKDSDKLRTYAKTKNKVELESYLVSCKSTLLRKYISKLRLSNHKLLIETGRYSQLPIGERNNC